MPSVRYRPEDKTAARRDARPEAVAHKNIRVDAALRYAIASRLDR